MSFFQNKQTEFEDQECLVGALADIGLGKKTTVHTNPQKLQGYGRGLAEIVIARGAFGNHYEAGFTKQNGKFTFVSADDDKLDMRHLNRSYAERKSMSLAAAKGMKFVGRKQTVDSAGKTNVKLIFQAVAAGQV